MEIIQEFAELNPRSAVVICGGESMLDATRYFGVSRLCLALGLRCLSVINGTCVANATTADRMIRDGPSEISVSLDDYREEKHDLQRGIKGPFQKAVQAVRLLREVRERHPERPVRIYVMALVHEDNYRELDAFHRFVLCDLRADKLKLNFLQPTFGGCAGNDEFFARHYIRDPDNLLAVLKSCDVKYQLGLNPAWLQTVEIYARSINEASARLGWDNPKATSKPICNSYERNSMVDMQGNARLCFSDAFPCMPLRRRGDLGRFWYEWAVPLRPKMCGCCRPAASATASAANRPHLPQKPVHNLDGGTT